jgi:uncharacterized glyoxalase superfamily protein PhnB
MQTIIPGLMYQDAPAAIVFLREAFGFAEHLVVPGASGTILHAQLVLGHNMVMLSSAMRPLGEPAAAAGYIYIVMDDVDGHCKHAEAYGAVILEAPRDQEYGGRGYSARDLEGNYWAFGSYDPWTRTGPEAGLPIR